MRASLQVLSTLCVLGLAARSLRAGEVDEWRAALQSERAMERFEAARRLRRAGQKAKAALPALIETLQDAEPWVRQEAARAVVAIGASPPEVAALLDRLQNGDPELGPLLADALAGTGEAAVPGLIELLKGDDERARRAALAAVALLGRHAAEAVPLLIDLVRDRDPATRKAAAGALRRCGPWAEEYVPEILEKFQFAKDDQTRWLAASVLGMIGPAAQEAIPALKRVRTEGKERLKAIAAGALRQIDVAPRRKEEHPALRKPELARAKAPERFQVRFETTRGVFVVEVERAWAPHGADRFYNLVKIGFFDDVAFFRVVPGFVAQFGMSGDSRVNAAWSGATIADDPVRLSNRRGTLTYAQTGQPNSRSTQLFFNLKDNIDLDRTRFAPIGRVVSGMKVVNSLHDGYGDLPAFGGKGPDPRALATMGNEYLRRGFPGLDYIERATLVEK